MISWIKGEVITLWQTNNKFYILINCNNLGYEIQVLKSIFIGLIVTNCIVMGRLEAFALGNGVWKSFLDGVGNAAGYGFILILVAFFRELLGSGKLYGYKVIPEFIYDLGYQDNGLMLLSPMALVTVGIFIWIQRARNRKLIEKN